MPEFVVLEHDHPELHWDLMLEHGGLLKTWRLPEFPRPGQKLLAQALADHRLHYLNYEGPVSGNRGSVVRRDRGTYEFAPECDADRFESGGLLLILFGSRLQGRLSLKLVEGNVWHLELLVGRASNG